MRLEREEEEGRKGEARPEATGGGGGGRSPRARPCTWGLCVRVRLAEQGIGDWW